MNTLNAVAALSKYLEQEEVLERYRGEILFIRAEAHPAFFSFKERLVCYQTFKPHAELLEKQGFRITDSLPGNVELVLYLPTKFKDENLHNFARGVSALKEGGCIVASMPNAIGAVRFENKLKSLVGDVNSMSKAKCRVFSAVLGAQIDQGLLAEWLALGESKVDAQRKMHTVPGVFSSKKIDRGSELLAQHLPESIAGCVADLGAGAGFLSVEALRRSKNIKELHLYEAERLALDCAKLNLSKVNGKETVAHYHWHDVTRGIPERKFDWIIMNPPFHKGIKVSMALGERFIAVALAGLKVDGKLLMVGKSHSPFFNVLQAQYRRVKQVAEQEGYEVFEAIK